MKDGKIALALALSLAALAGVFYYMSLDVGESEPHGPRMEDTLAPSPALGTSRRIPHDQWPRVKRPVGTRPSGPAPDAKPLARKDWPEKLTKELLADLMERLAAGGDLEALRILEHLLKYGIIEDAEGIAKGMVAALAKGGRYASYVAVLLPLLKDEDAKAKAAEDLLLLAREAKAPQVLKAAFLLVGQLGGESAIKDLADFARNLEKRETAAAAVYALAAIESEGGAAELASLLAGKLGTPLESDIIKAIGRTAAMNPGIVDHMVPFLSGDQPDELKEAAARALGLTRSPDAVEPLRRLFEAETSRALKGVTLEGLGAIGDRASTETLVGVFKAGGMYATDAGMAIGNVRGADAAPVILGVIDSVDDVRVKSSMVRGLSGTGSPEALKKLEGYLGSPTESQGVRGVAARGLAANGVASAVPAMAAALSSTLDGERNFRIDLVKSMQRLIQVPAARVHLTEKALPVLREMTRERVDSTDYFYALRLRQVIESIR